jgi:hypothetical protein
VLQSYEKIILWNSCARMIFSILTSDYYLFHWYIYICKSKHCTIIKTLCIILLFYIFKKSIEITFTQIFQIIYIRQQNLTCETCEYHTQVNTLIIWELGIASLCTFHSNITSEVKSILSKTYQRLYNYPGFVRVRSI